jgi:hypothetical protein
MPDDLKLNSISRFSKASSRLHLEEHGHCEVPAGCGGVVLRWYNPAKALPLLFVIYCPTRARLFINGIESTSARPLVPLGAVVLALEFETVVPGQALFVLAGGRNETFHFSEEATCVLRSVPDGSWRFNVARPPNEWMMPEFDGSAWPALVERPVDPPSPDDYRRHYATEWLTRFGARPLGVPAEVPATQVWVRKEFRNEA